MHEAISPLTSLITRGHIWQFSSHQINNLLSSWSGSPNLMQPILSATCSPLPSQDSLKIPQESLHHIPISPPYSWSQYNNKQIIVMVTPVPKLHLYPLSRVAFPHTHALISSGGTSGISPPQWAHAGARFYHPQKCKPPMKDQDSAEILSA